MDTGAQSFTVHSTPLRHSKQYQQSLERSNFPVVLLAIAGHHLVVSTAISTDSVYANETFSVSLRVSTHVADDVLRVAGVFMALSKCMKTGGLNGEARRHLMYLATIRAGDDSEATVVLVKLAAKYNEDAHHLLAGQVPPSLRTSMPASVSSALDLLHSKEFVFGDLREQNVLHLSDGTLFVSTLKRGSVSAGIKSWRNHMISRIWRDMGRISGEEEGDWGLFGVIGDKVL
ncbi:hypothetical protein BJ322DRAFT_1218142 [Thelephora terrestris]|uniref:Protein kinase domain-containing protein n=1 Tax=Thelephora terrestris TaxID=56493 RepID=A0A9P6HI63_9AGAM|nr:hypothetical protein BJ322DRAFT_1218142 [Thelephora terrestris]